MEALLYILLGGAAGSAIGVVIGLRLGRGPLTAEVAGLSAASGELRNQLTARDAELSGLRRLLSENERASTEARARLESAREHFAEQRRQIEEMEKKVKETFSALSSAALKSNNEQFMTLAQENMKPLREQLGRYEKQIQEMEKTRAEAYGGLAKHLQRLEEGREKLSRETGLLVSALRQPGATGRWGEVTLRNVVELTGMSAYCDFEEQAALQGEGGRMKPDLVVRLPGGRSLVVDSKVNASAYLDAVQCGDEQQRKVHLARYCAGVRTTMRGLAGKEYWRGLAQTPEFVVMFMPGEAFFAAAVGADPRLLQDGVELGVLLASPTTLSALLMAIRYGWQQQQVAENAEKIAAAGRDLHDRLCKFAEHLDRIRGGLSAAARAYNDAVGSWETRTLPSARKLKDLDAAGAGKDVGELRCEETVLRAIPLDDESEALRRETA
ncbi:MAG TPA: DNA recombination protein RmuC [Phycisphaerae bacterium]|nr:DNA recombination protein RmuC [Phycisphaerae bacterium]